MCLPPSPPLRQSGHLAHTQDSSHWRSTYDHLQQDFHDEHQHHHDNHAAHQHHDEHERKHEHQSSASAPARPEFSRRQRVYYFVPAASQSANGCVGGSDAVSTPAAGPLVVRGGKLVPRHPSAPNQSSLMTSPQVPPAKTPPQQRHSRQVRPLRQRESPQATSPSVGPPRASAPRLTPPPQSISSTLSFATPPPHSSPPFAPPKPSLSFSPVPRLVSPNQRPPLPNQKVQVPHEKLRLPNQPTPPPPATQRRSPPISPPAPPSRHASAPRAFPHFPQSPPSPPLSPDAPNMTLGDGDVFFAPSPPASAPRTGFRSGQRRPCFRPCGGDGDRCILRCNSDNHMDRTRRAAGSRHPVGRCGGCEVEEQCESRLEQALLSPSRSCVTPPACRRWPHSSSPSSSSAAPLSASTATAELFDQHEVYSAVFTESPSFLEADTTNQAHDSPCVPCCHCFTVTAVALSPQLPLKQQWYVSSATSLSLSLCPIRPLPLLLSPSPSPTHLPLFVILPYLPLSPSFTYAKLYDAPCMG
ncbi:unnamed protein product [Closterium sp. NIES-54]